MGAGPTRSRRAPARDRVNTRRGCGGAGGRRLPEAAGSGRPAGGPLGAGRTRVPGAGAGRSRGPVTSPGFQGSLPAARVRSSPRSPGPPSALRPAYLARGLAPGPSRLLPLFLSFPFSPSRSPSPVARRPLRLPSWTFPPPLSLSFLSPSLRSVPLPPPFLSASPLLRARLPPGFSLPLPSLPPGILSRPPPPPPCPPPRSPSPLSASSQLPPLAAPQSASPNLRRRRRRTGRLGSPGCALLGPAPSGLAGSALPRLRLGPARPGSSPAPERAEDVSPARLSRSSIPRRAEPERSAAQPRALAGSLGPAARSRSSGAPTPPPPHRRPRASRRRRRRRRRSSRAVPWPACPGPSAADPVRRGRGRWAEEVPPRSPRTRPCRRCCPTATRS